MWPQYIEELHGELVNQGKDSWIFRMRDDGKWIAVGGLDHLGITTLMMVADYHKFTSARFNNLYMRGSRYCR
jgi:hypothetical protein